MVSSSLSLSSSVAPDIGDQDSDEGAQLTCLLLSRLISSTNDAQYRSDKRIACLNLTLTLFMAGVTGVYAGH